MNNNTLTDSGMVILQGGCANHIIIPEDIIFNNCLDSKRVSVFSYLYVKAGLDNSLLFSPKFIGSWLGKKYNEYKDKKTFVNKLIQILDDFKKFKFFFCSEELTYATIAESIFDKNAVYTYCQEKRFAKIYIDEVNAIIQYKNDKIKDTLFDNSIILLVFAYLRLNIPTNNDLSGAVYRPEAFDQYYNKIGEELGISERMVSKAVDILVEMDLIYVRSRSPIKYWSKREQSEKFLIPTHIFCNTYKRIKKNGNVYLMASGESYYLNEADSKEEVLNSKLKK